MQQTGWHYNGVKIMRLWLSAQEQGCDSIRWLPWKQAQAASGNVSKAEKATFAVFFKLFEVEATDKSGQPRTNAQGETVMEQRIIMLFNIEHCKGLQENLIGAGPKILDDESLDSDQFDYKKARRP